MDFPMPASLLPRYSAPLRFGFLAAGLTLLSACATVARPDADPYEGFNRKMYAFNDSVDRAVLEPTAKGYRAVTNEPVRQGVSNFLFNVSEPVNFANNLLQGKLPQAASTAGRFVVNTTVGIAGVFDPAQAIGLEKARADFGTTLGRWGFASGPYLVLPFMGSSSPRDIFGRVGDGAMNPINYARFEGDTETRVGLGVLGLLSGREQAIETIDDLRTSQIDPYATVRRFYVRDRAADAGIPVAQSEDAEKVLDFELDF
jgi:phospholipid-binding lipoprotein MlaA